LAEEWEKTNSCFVPLPIILPIKDDAPCGLAGLELPSDGNWRS
jgi:hypothetical protein